MDSQSNQNQKDITYLNSKPWYRFLKVLYILILGLTIGLSIPTALVFGWLQLILIAPIAVLFLLEIAKRSLYYVVTGRVFPSRQGLGTLPSKLYFLASYLTILISCYMSPRWGFGGLRLLVFYTHTAPLGLQQSSKYNEPLHLIVDWTECWVSLCLSIGGCG